MQRKKAVVDAKIESAKTSKGLILIHTGIGKGKSTAAFGLLARALGHGMKAAVIQFVKSRSDSGEEAFFRNCVKFKLARDGRWFYLGNPKPRTGFGYCAQGMGIGLRLSS